MDNNVSNSSIDAIKSDADSIEHLKEINATMEKEISHFEDSLKRKIDTVKSYAYQFDELKQENILMKMEISDLEDSLNREIERLKLDADIFKELKQENMYMKREIAKLKNKVDDTSADFILFEMKLVQDFNNQISNNNATVHSKIDAIKSDIDRIRELEDVNKSMKNEISQLNDAVNKKSPDFIQFKAEFVNDLNNFISNNNANFVNEINAIKADVVCINKLKEENESMKKEISHLNDAINKKSSDYIQFKTELMKDLENLISNYNATYSLKIDSIKSDVDSTLKIKRDNESLRREMSYLRDSLNEKFIQLKTEVFEDTDMIIANKVATLNSNINAIKLDTNKKFREENKSMKKEVSHLRDAFNAKFDAIRSDAYNIEELEDENKSMKGEISKLKVLFNRTSTHIMNYKENVLKNVNELISNNMTSMQSDIIGIKGDIYDVKAMKNEILSMKEEISQLIHVSTEISTNFIKFKKEILNNIKDDSQMEPENTNEIVPQNNLGFSEMCVIL